MSLSRARMLDRTFAKDGAFDRRFIVGVLSTGIYCVPSCKAPKPKPENVAFFASPAEAALRGLRPCKRCVPDQAFAGIDPDEILFEGLMGRVRASPEQFSGVEAMAREVGVSLSKLHAGVRTYYHTTPLEALTTVRVERAAERLTAGDVAIPAVAEDVGFASTSAFYENFVRTMGLAPAAYRSLGEATEFTISLPNPYPHQLLIGYLGRDPLDPTIRRCGNCFRFTLPDEPLASLSVAVESATLRVNVSRVGAAIRAHEVLRRVAGLNQDPRAFDSTLVSDARFECLAVDAGLRVFQTSRVFDAIVWAVVGQQMTVKFAMKLRRCLFELADVPAVEGVYRPLTPSDLVDLEPSQLVDLQYSARKAEYLIGVSRRFVEEGLDPEAMRGWPATKAARWLAGVRGFGPWSTNYAMMRGCGFADCVPVGDSGLTSGLRRLYRLSGRPSPAETERLMRPFEPHRSLATFRIWYSRRLWDEASVMA